MSEEDEKNDKLPLLREKPVKLNYTKRYDQVSWHSADTDFEPDPSASSADERRHKIKRPAFSKKRKQKIAALVIVVVIFLSVMIGLIYVYVKRGGDYIEIPCGKILGVSEGGIYIYKGIPYAKSPLNQLRWKKPVSYGNSHCWKNVFKADTYARACAGGKPGNVVGSEDCLYLNVYTTAKPNTQVGLIPVIVYFPSELSSQNIKSDEGNSLLPSPSFVKEMNAVVVSVNYRIDYFGFLALPNKAINESYYGNLGLYDQIVALDWVKENIKHFGGDYNSITIFGHTSVYALLASPLSHGKFHKAFAFGGSTNFNVTYQTAAAFNERKLYKSKCGNLTSNSLEACLQRLTTDEVLDIFYVDSDSRWDFPKSSTDILMDYLTILEPYLLPNPPQLIPERPLTKISILIGNTAQESGLKSTINLKSWDQLEKLMLPRLNSFSANFSNTILNKLYSNKTHDITPNKLYQTITSDMRIICPTNSLAAKLQKSSNYVVYRYIMTSSSDESIFHNADIQAFLNTNGLFGKKLRENMMHFIKYGHPSEFGWDASTTAIIDDKGTISLLSEEYHKEICLFWNNPKNGFTGFAWRN